jgi:hypothetical protein
MSRARSSSVSSIGFGFRPLTRVIFMPLGRGRSHENLIRNELLVRDTGATYCVRPARRTLGVVKHARQRFQVGHGQRASP